MLNKISHQIAKWLLSQGAISARDYDLYVYAVSNFIFSSIPVIIIVILGILFGMLREGILIILPFLLLRKYSGGFHVNSRILCFFLSTLLIILCMLTCHSTVQAQEYSNILPICVALSTLSLITLSPISSPQRPLTHKERNIFEKIAIWLSLSLFFVFFLLHMLGSRIYSTPIGLGIILTSVLQLPCLCVRRKTSSINSDVSQNDQTCI